MSWPFRDYDFYGVKYINIKDENSPFGEKMWYDRENIHSLPTECIICIEAENESYTKYAHPKAHPIASKQASINAELLALKEINTQDYIDYYTFYYGREYEKLYKELYKKYKQEYSAILLSKNYKLEDKICHHHLESIQYHCELN
jgi:hypothetical protein